MSPRPRSLWCIRCNCAWRFKNFNVDHPELTDCRDAHRELQARIEALDEGEFTAGAVEDVLDDLVKVRKLRRTREVAQQVPERSVAFSSPASAGISRGLAAVCVAALAAGLVLVSAWKRR